MVQIGEAVAGFWEKIGVKVEMKTVEWGVFDPMGRGEQKGLVGTASMFRTAGRPEPSPRYQTTLTSTGVQHLLGDPKDCPAVCKETDKAYEEAVSEKDDAKRAAAMNKMTELGVNSWMVVPHHRGHGVLGGEPEARRPVQADPRSPRVRRRGRAHAASRAEALELTAARDVQRFILRRVVAEPRCCSSCSRSSSSRWRGSPAIRPICSCPRTPRATTARTS